MAGKNWYRISVLYSGGQTIQFVTDLLDVQYANGKVTKMAWGEIKSGPHPVVALLDNIIGVWSEPT